MKNIYSLMMSTVAVLSLSTSLAFAAPTASIASGTTTVRLNDVFISALRSANIRLSKVEESKLQGSIITFPVIEGVLDLANARGEVEHSGGFRLSTPTTTIRLANFILDTQNFTPTISAEAVINDSVVGRIPLFDVALPAITLPIKSARTITIQGAVLRLRSEAADAVNTALDQTVLRGGQRVGRAVVTVNTGRSS
jgi:hypothetical protein